MDMQTNAGWGLMSALILLVAATAGAEPTTVFHDDFANGVAADSKSIVMYGNL